MSRGEDKTKRSIFRFSLGSIFLWTVVAALACGWLLNFAYLRNEIRKLRSQFNTEVARRTEAEVDLEVLRQHFNNAYQLSDDETKEKIMAAWKESSR